MLFESYYDQKTSNYKKVVSPLAVLLYKAAREISTRVLQLNNPRWVQIWQLILGDQAKNAHGINAILRR